MKTVFIILTLLVIPMGISSDAYAHCGTCGVDGEAKEGKMCPHPLGECPGADCEYCKAGASCEQCDKEADDHAGHGH